MASATLARALSDDQLEELLELVRGADSVELKLTVPESEQYSTVAALGLDPLDAQIRQVFFFDTADLQLNKKGIVVRARRIQGKRGDSIVKLRPVVPDHLSAELRQSPGFNVEVDAMPGGFVCSATLRSRLPNSDVREVAQGTRALKKLFTREQRDFLAEHAGDGPLLGDLALLGPIFVLKLRSSPEGYDRSLVVEAWLYPDNSRVLELSTKCEPSEAFQVAAETRVFLSSRGVDLSAEQQTKTVKALRFFAKRCDDDG